MRGRLVHLRQLELSENNLDDSGLVHLKTLPQLEDLGLARTNVTNSGIVQLVSLTNLEELDLQDTKVTKEGIGMLQKAIPHCEIQLGNFRQQLATRVFAQFDKDKDGRLIPEELGAQSRLLKADVDGDGGITKEELERFLD